MRDNMELFWGVLDDISSSGEAVEKRKKAMQKSRELSDGERRDMVDFIEEHCEELAASGIYLVLQEINGGLVDEDMYWHCLAGILFNGRYLYEQAIKDPGCIKQYNLKELSMDDITDVF